MGRIKREVFLKLPSGISRALDSQKHGTAVSQIEVSAECCFALTTPDARRASYGKAVLAA